VYQLTFDKNKVPTDSIDNYHLLNS